MSNILYIGSSGENTTSEHRRLALERIGHRTISVDLTKIMAKYIANKIFSYVNYRTGYFILQKVICRELSKVVYNLERKIDLIWVNSGELLGSEALTVLKSLGAPVILYNNDDPFGGRDGKRFKQLEASLHLYDLAIAVRPESVDDFKAKGARRCKMVYMPYDELYHRPLDSDDMRWEDSRFQSDVVFVGTWMPHEKRDVFALKLLEHGVPVSIWGNAWNKSPYWSRLKNFHRGFSIYGRDYVAALSRAKICLGLLSKGNRDQYTTRSFEVPFSSGLLCCERTKVHSELFNDGEHVVMWDNVGECARVCLDLLNDNRLRDQIRTAGKVRVEGLGVGNNDVCQQILNYL